MSHRSRHFRLLSTDTGGFSLTRTSIKLNSNESDTTYFKSFMSPQIIRVHKTCSLQVHCRLSMYRREIIFWNTHGRDSQTMNNITDRRSWFRTNQRRRELWHDKNVRRDDLLKMSRLYYKNYESIFIRSKITIFMYINTLIY